MRADDFNAKTKRLLAQRVGYLCSNPDCKAMTCGPCEHPDKSVLTGDAAHITAASAGGARYDLSLTSEQRRDYSNGIWLCTICARIIDRDVSRYPMETLRKWKSQAEAHAMKCLGKPQTRLIASSDDVRRFVKLAKFVVAGLRTDANEPSAVGLEGPLEQMEAIAVSLDIPVPIEIRTIPYPQGVAPNNPFLKQRLEGRLTIRFPDGTYENGCGAHVSGLELLFDARESAVVALEQWVIDLEGRE